MTDGWGISGKIALRWMPLDLTDEKSTLFRVMTWCRQATSHYLRQFWPRFMSPYGVTRPQWVKQMVSSHPKHLNCPNVDSATHWKLTASIGHSLYEIFFAKSKCQFKNYFFIKNLSFLSLPMYSWSGSMNHWYMLPIQGLKNIKKYSKIIFMITHRIAFFISCKCCILQLK